MTCFGNDFRNDFCQFRFSNKNIEFSEITVVGKYLTISD